MSIPRMNRQMYPPVKTERRGRVTMRRSRLNIIICKSNVDRGRSGVIWEAGEKRKVDLPSDKEFFLLYFLPLEEPSPSISAV